MYDDYGITIYFSRKLYKDKNLNLKTWYPTIHNRPFRYCMH